MPANFSGIISPMGTNSLKAAGMGIVLYECPKCKHKFRSIGEIRQVSCPSCNTALVE